MSVSLEKRGLDFSIRIAELSRFLREDGKNFPLCDRLIFCGVTAGLAVRGGNWREAAECIKETVYIIDMAVVAGYMTPRQDVHIRSDCETLLKILAEKQETKSEEEN